MRTAPYGPLMVVSGSRLVPPPFPADEVTVAAPPTVPQAAGGLTLIVPMLAVIVMLAMGLMVWSPGLAPRAPTSLMFPGMMVMSALGMLAQSAVRRGAAELDDHRRRYLDHLGVLAESLCQAAAAQRESLIWTHPGPAALWTLVGGPRTFERAPGDSDFGHLRVGVGVQRVSRRLVLPPTPPAYRLDPVSAAMLRRFVQAHTTVEAAPVAVALRGVLAVSVAGDPERARDLLRAMACQLAVLHDPRDLRIAAVVGPGGSGQWDWLKWLPHNDHPQRGSMFYDTLGQAAAALADVSVERGTFDPVAAPSHPHAVIIVDGPDSTSSPALRPGIAAVTILTVGRDCPAGGLRLRIDGDRLAVLTGSGDEVIAVADGLAAADALVCARRLARHRPPEGASAADPLHRWCTELGIGRDGQPGWARHDERDRLRVPIGTAAHGGLVELDIKEAAEGGHGPHGLCVGATGSGKSELLRTVVLGMVARHPPEALNLVLIDFKGGATFLGLDALHHVAAVITNLSEESHLVARMKDALGGEVHRRQQLLRRAGVASARIYRQRCRADPSLPALPSLLVVIDEFAELLQHHQDFVELFGTIGRLGRSLGVHLMLASQRLDEGRLRGLDSHLSYRICLKTLTAAESRAVLGVGDAAELTGGPGAALLRTDDGTLTRFQSVHVGAPDPTARVAREPASPPVCRFTSLPAAVAPPIADPTPPPVFFDTLVRRLGGRGTRAHAIWLPPLVTSPELAELAQIPAAGLTAPIGLVDLPFEQRRRPLIIDIGGAAGNIAVVGAAQTGKSATVAAVVTALASRHAPRRIQWYCLDFGGGALRGLSTLPHVGSVTGRQDRDRVHRTVGHVMSVLRARERQAAGEDDDDYGHVVLVIDGWAVFRAEYTELEPAITAIATQGLSHGVHLLITAGRWADLRPALKDQFGTRIELRLGDPVDSEMDRKQAALVPIGRPGRGITEDGYHFIVARPDPGAVTADRNWVAPPIRVLPDAVEHDALVRRADADAAGVILGLGEDELAPVAVDFTQQAHLMIFGDGACGKTATLRTLCREIVRGAATRSARLFVIDLRRTLLDTVGDTESTGYAFSTASLAQQLPRLIAVLESRLPNAHTTVEQLRNGSWWAGPQVFVVVDDYDLVAATSPDALNGLMRLLPHAADIGLHIVLARRCAGTARAMFDPLLTQLRDGGCMGLLMNGSPDEGPLIGNHRAAAYPAGRGLLVTKAGRQLVQVGWCPPRSR